MKYDLELTDLVENKDFPELVSHGRTIRMESTGKLLYNIDWFTPYNNYSTLLTIKDNDVIETSYTLNNNGVNKFPYGLSESSNLNNYIEPDTTYTIVCEIFEIKNSIHIHMVSGQGEGGNYACFPYWDLSNITKPGIYYKVTKSYSDLSEKDKLFRTFFYFSPGEEGSAKIRISLIKGDISSEISSFKYEPYSTKLFSYSSTLTYIPSWNIKSGGHNLYHVNDGLSTSSGVAFLSKNSVTNYQGLKTDAYGSFASTSLLGRSGTFYGKIYNSDDSINKLNIHFCLKDSDGNISYSSNTVTLDKSELSITVYMQSDLAVRKYTQGNARIMCNYGSDPLPWEPYTNEKIAYTDNEYNILTPLTIDPTSDNQLRGIQTTSEYSNWTNPEDNTTWCSDVIDWANGKYEKHVEVLENIDYSEWQLFKDWENGYITIYGEVENEFDSYIPSCLCSHLKNVKFNELSNGDGIYCIDKKIFITIEAKSLAGAESKLMSLENFKIYRATLNNPTISSFTPIRLTGRKMYLQCDAGLEGKYLRCDKITL